jgi:predicted short-subunit dehydrogenase-like oxidoreductase (DUF2520 family)
VTRKDASKVQTRIFGIAGDGRVARHLRDYFRLKQIPFREWSRRAEAEARVPAAHEALSGCAVVLILLKDSAIENWFRAFENNLSGARPIFVHFSGTLRVEGVEAWHPLMSFAKAQTYDLKTYESLAFVGSRGAKPFEEVFPELRNPHYTLSEGQRAFYHALCVLAGNFSVMLWRKLFEGFELELGLPRDAAYPYMAQVFANTISNPVDALTGPLQRKDTSTLNADLRALDSDSFRGVFEAFVKTQIPDFGQNSSHMNIEEIKS